MGRPDAARLPIEPLLALTARTCAHARDGRQLVGIPAPITALAARIGVSRRQVHRWIADGGVPFYSADAAARALGDHPCDLWGGAWWAASYEQGCLEQDLLARQDRAVRGRRELVDGYAQVERARDRGPHRCAVDGCRCGAQVQDDQEAAA